MKYRTIVADPPWKYASAATKADASKHYDTQPLGWILSLGDTVRELAEDDAHLWLWTTNAFIEEQVSPEPYLEMFSRRARLGWEVWGNESLGTVELAV